MTVIKLENGILEMLVDMSQNAFDLWWQHKLNKQKCTNFDNTKCSMNLHEKLSEIAPNLFRKWLIKFISDRHRKYICFHTCSECFHLNDSDISTIEFLLMRKTHKIKWFMLTTIEPIRNALNWKRKFVQQTPLAVSFLIPITNKYNHSVHCTEGIRQIEWCVCESRSLGPNVYKNATPC